AARRRRKTPGRAAPRGQVAADGERPLVRLPQNGGCPPGPRRHAFAGPPPGRRRGRSAALRRKPPCLGLTRRPPTTRPQPSRRVREDGGTRPAEQTARTSGRTGPRGQGPRKRPATPLPRRGRGGTTARATVAAVALSRPALASRH